MKALLAIELLSCLAIAVGVGLLLGLGAALVVAGVLGVIGSEWGQLQQARAAVKKRRDSR